MARIRTIKPQFFANELLAELPFESRLLFVALWTLADNAGRLEYRPKRIGAYAFPYEPDVMQRTAELLEGLENSGFIQTYDAEGIPVVQICKFELHQRITGKESKYVSTFPPPPGNNRETTGKQPGKIPSSGIRNKEQGIRNKEQGKEVSSNFGETSLVSLPEWKEPNVQDVLIATASENPSTNDAIDYILARQRDADPDSGRWRIFNPDGVPRMLSNWQADALTWIRRRKLEKRNGRTQHGTAEERLLEAGERRNERKDALGIGRRSTDNEQDSTEETR